MFEAESKRGDSNAEGGIELSERFVECFIIDPCGVKEFPTIRPDRCAESLEEIFTEGVDVSLNTESTSAETEWWKVQRSLKTQNGIR